LGDAGGGAGSGKPYLRHPPILVVLRSVHARALAILVAIGIAAFALAACGGGNNVPLAGISRHSSSGAPGGNAASSSGVTLVATTHGAIPSFAAPGGAQSGTVPSEWQGAPSTLPVIALSPGWYEVRLAQRPNGSTAWVLAQDVTVASTPYRIVIDLASTHLTLWRNNQQVFSTPVGIGTPQYPTPTGHYFVALFAQPPSPAYGAFVMVTSDHSDTITDWERSGDAIIAIHGPLGSDQQIGTTGAAISHGCIRLHEPDLLRLRDVPVGSPVEIDAT
jgi:lipoprotein-anchoring transpeptidase ErfK/SrfK